MLSRMEVTEPPKAAPTEIDASISSADSGSIENVNGIRIAMATGPPRPGSTPTHSPITVPTIMNRNCLSCSAAMRPRMRWSSISARPQRELVDEPVAHQAVGKVDVQQIRADHREYRHRDDRDEHQLPAVGVSHQHRHQQHRRERGDDEADQPER